AMASLSAKARNRSTRSCSASGRVTEPSEPTPPVTPPPAPPVVTDPVQTDRGPVAPATIRLQVTGSRESGKQYMRLTWSGITGSMVDVYRNGVLKKLTENDEWYTNVRSHRGATSYVYKVCERGTTVCSAPVRVDVR
ncbi:MAG TPA: hypothetical protein VGP44_03640, partial [Gemmatimonadales bacterium]|nr:hypothetical protein [Gemmatimonadales bacterium]